MNKKWAFYIYSPSKKAKNQSFDIIWNIVYCYIFPLTHVTRKLSTTKNVEVDVRNALTTMCTNIRNNTIAMRNTLFFRGITDHAHKMCHNLVYYACTSASPSWISAKEGICFFGIARRWTGAWGEISLITIASSKMAYFVILVDEGRWDFTFDYFCKYGIFHHCAYAEPFYCRKDCSER